MINKNRQDKKNFWSFRLLILGAFTIAFIYSTTGCIPKKDSYRDSYYGPSGRYSDDCDNDYGYYGRDNRDRDRDRNRNQRGDHRLRRDRDYHGRNKPCIRRQGHRSDNFRSQHDRRSRGYSFRGTAISNYIELNLDVQVRSDSATTAQGELVVLDSSYGSCNFLDRSYRLSTVEPGQYRSISDSTYGLYLEGVGNRGHQVLIKLNNLHPSTASRQREQGFHTAVYLVEADNRKCGHKQFLLNPPHEEDSYF